MNMIVNHELSNNIQILLTKVLDKQYVSTEANTNEFNELFQLLIQFYLEQKNNIPNISFAGQENVKELHAVQCPVLNQRLALAGVQPIDVKGYVPEGMKFYKEEDITQFFNKI